MEKRVLVDTFKVRLFCDDCDGDMVATGEALMSNPAQYIHVCKNCGKVVRVRGKKYPFIEYKERF